jgi:hypothetical protein
MKDRSKIIEYQSCWYDIQGNHLEHCLSFEQNKEKQKLIRKQRKDNMIILGRPIHRNKIKVISRLIMVLTIITISLLLI